MKRLLNVAFGAIALGGVLLAGARVATAQAKPTFTFSIEVEDASTVKVTGVGPADTLCAADKVHAEACLLNATPERCHADEGFVYQLPAAAKSFDLSAKADPQPPPWLQRALVGDKLWCGVPPAGAAVPEASGATTAITPGAAVAVATAAADGGIELMGGLDPVSGTANQLLWTGWQEPSYRGIWASVGKPAAADPCTLTDQAGKARPKCTLTLEPVPAGSQRLRIQYTGDPVTSGSVKFQIGKYKFKGQIKSCDLSPRVTPTSLGVYLFAGAESQTLTLSTPSDCGSRITGSAVTLTRDSAPTLNGTLSALGGQVRLMLTNVPATVTSGTWKLLAADLHLGDVTLQVVTSPLTVRSGSDNLPALGIHYDLQDSPTDLDRWQNGQSRAGMALVTKARGDHEQYIQNTASLQVDRTLSELGEELEQRHRNWEPPRSRPARKVKCSADPRAPSTCGDLETRYGPDAICDRGEIPDWVSRAIDECHRARRPWRVTPYSWRGSVWLKGDGWWYPDTAIALTNASNVTFAVFQNRPEPFEVVVQLVDYDETNGSEQVVFSQRVTIASGARLESLPLPLAKALYVECGHHAPPHGLFPPTQPSTDATADVVLNGYTRAVDDEDVLTGNCRLYYSPDRALEALGLPPGDASQDILKYYGPQQLSVTVRRGEAQAAAQPFPIDPSVESELQISAPADAKNATGIYVVTAALDGPSLPAVTWRYPPVDPASGAGTNLDSLAFHANLRPRGPFGWKSAPIRVFLTLPVAFTGVRFPARPSELTVSSNSPNVQVTKVQAGALLAVEPWNYDTGRNPWPIPARFVTGMNLYNISDGKFAPSWVTGVSFTLPIIDLQKGITEDQLSSDIALGLFWETDVAEHDWSKHGNHFLATFGVNLLSLFGSK